MSDLIRREAALLTLKIFDYDIIPSVLARQYVREMLDTLYVKLNELPSAEPERTAKAIRKPEAFFYRCECGYGLCCEKNDMNYCPHCGARLEWDE